MRRSWPCSEREERGQQQQGLLQENRRKPGCCVWRKAQGEAGKGGVVVNSLHLVSTSSLLCCLKFCESRSSPSAYSLLI